MPTAIADENVCDVLSNVLSNVHDAKPNVRDPLRARVLTRNVRGLERNVRVLKSADVRVLKRNVRDPL